MSHFGLVYPFEHEDGMFNQFIGNIARKPQDNIARRIMKCHTLKRLGDRWRNSKYALKEAMIHSFKPRTSIVSFQRWMPPV